MSFADALQRRWYAGVPAPWWARPLAALYGGVTGIRRALFRGGALRARRMPVPVIVVGNIAVGGTGKTPLTIALVDALAAQGYMPGVVSRGYGGSARGPVLLDARAAAAQVGDEPALIRARTGRPVAVGADRATAARLLLDRGVNVIVADDGLQHYALARDVEICVVDGMRRLGNGRLLPAGPLREPASRLGDVDFIVCNGGEPVGREVPMQLVARDAVEVRAAANRLPLSSFAGRRVHAVAGIGNPARFFGMLRAGGIGIVAHPFADHHRYAASDLGFEDALPVLMTEKDAVKCRDFARPGWWAVPVTARLPDSFFAAVIARIDGTSPRTSHP